MRLNRTAAVAVAVLAMIFVAGHAFAAETTAPRGILSRLAPNRPAAESPAPQAAAPHLVAYYFHGNKRCATCMAIEENSHKAVERALGPELKAGEADWRTVNYDERANRHFAKEFKLAFPTVVLVEERDGKAARWKTLDQTWTKVRESPEALQAYVGGEAKAFAAGPAAP